MNKSKFESIIHEAVRKEVRQYVSILLPIVVNEVLEFKMNEKKSLTESIAEDIEEPINRTSVAKKLNNTILTSNDVNFLGNRNSLSQLLGNKPERQSAINTPSQPQKMLAVTEHGTPVEVPIENVPDDVVAALTKDYRPLMQALKNKKNGSN